MKNWSFAFFLAKSKIKKINPQIVSNAKNYIENQLQNNVPVILTLGHLAKRANIAYWKLHFLTHHRILNYKTFNIKKHSGGYRRIFVPKSELMYIQKWINKFILSNLKSSQYSFAYTKGLSIKDCSEPHIDCKWLIKLDLHQFFESISEIQVYKLFHSLGYSKLLSLQFARICTITVPKNTILTKIKKNSIPKWMHWNNRKYKIYNEKQIGFLPQGAPTSPALANLIASKMDYDISELAIKNDFIYTRYADDLFISSQNSKLTKEEVTKIVYQIYQILPKYGFKINQQKTKIIGPGARKVILGLLVSNKVTLMKSRKAHLECELYYFIKDPIYHCQNRNISNIFSYSNHLKGLLSFIYGIDKNYYKQLEERNLIPDFDLLFNKLTQYDLSN